VAALQMIVGLLTKLVISTIILEDLGNELMVEHTTLVLEAEPAIKCGSLEEVEKEVDMVFTDVTETNGLRLLAQLSESLLIPKVKHGW